MIKITKTEIAIALLLNHSCQNCIYEGQHCCRKISFIDVNWRVAKEYPAENVCPQYVRNWYIKIL